MVTLAEYNSDKFSFSVAKNNINELTKQDFIEKSLVKIFAFRNESSNIPYDRKIVSINSLRKYYHGQTYLIYPFKLVDNDIVLLDDDFKTCLGCVVISKRDIREKYVRLKRASAEEVKKVAMNEINNFILNYKALLNGRYFNVKIKYMNKEQEMNVVATDYEDFCEKVFSNLQFIDGEFDETFINNTDGIL